MSNHHETDIAIIGAGPAGLFAVFEAGMLKLRCHVIDALDAVGGQCAALYPEKPIYDIPGYPATLAQELVAKLEAQAAPFGPVYHLGQRVESITRVHKGDMPGGQQSDPALSAASSRGQESEREANITSWQLVTASGTTITTRAVLIAAGCGAFGPNRPPLAGIEAYEGTSVHYLVKRREDFRGKRIVIAGGGDSAVDWAVSLAELAEKIYVVHRRPKFRAAPESVSKMEALAAAGNIEMVIPYQLDGLEGANGQLTGVIVSTLEGEKKTLAADCLLPFFGLSMELGPIAEWGLNLDQNHITVNPATMQTSAPGIYAIGDIATYPGKLKLILCGFAEAAMAAHAARAYMFPGEALHFEYSTTKGVPGS